MIQLHPRWRDLLRYAWSVRLLLIAAVLSGLEIALPLLDSRVPDRWRLVFAIAVFAVIVAAFIARFVAQKKLGAT